jgi:hypothetical protein
VKKKKPLYWGFFVLGEKAVRGEQGTAALQHA